MSLSKEELLAVVRGYWDSSNEFLYKQETSPETKRLQSLWTQKLENMGPWNAFLAELESELPNFIVGDTLTTGDASLRCVVYPLKEFRSSSDWVVVGCVSILAPVYIVYGVELESIEGGSRHHKSSFGQPPSNMVFPARVVARMIETTFGFSEVPREFAETPVPLFVNGKEPPETTLFHALFTSEPSIIP